MSKLKGLYGKNYSRAGRPTSDSAPVLQASQIDRLPVWNIVKIAYCQEKETKAGGKFYLTLRLVSDDPSFVLWTNVFGWQTDTWEKAAGIEGRLIDSDQFVGRHVEVRLDTEVYNDETRPKVVEVRPLQEDEKPVFKNSTEPPSPTRKQKPTKDEEEVPF